MKMLLNYIYYRIYRFAEIIAIGLTNVVPRAAAVLSFTLLFNTAAVLELFDLGLSKYSLVFYLIYFSILYYISFRLFSDEERQKKVKHLFEKETLGQSFIGNSGVAIICILTIVFFVKAKIG